MKKTRLLSLLMAVALVFTSLPLMATAVVADAAPAAMEKGDKIAIPNKADNWTGIAAYDESYASAWIRGGGYDSFLIRLYKPGEANNLVTAGTEYVAKLAARTPDATFAAAKPISTATKWDSTNILYMIHSLGSGTGYLGTRHSINVANLTTTPTEYSITFTVPTGTDKTWSLRLHEGGGVGSVYAPIGVAGIIVYEAANPSNVVYSWGQFSTDSANKNWSAISTFGQTYHGNTYLGADVTAATGATYDVADATLLPGVYQLTGTFSTDADSIALSAKLNDTVMNVGSTTTTELTIDTNATTVYYMLNVEEETTLETLGLAWTVNGAATKLVLSDLSFKCVELTGNAGKNASIKRGTVVATAESIAFWSADDAGASVEIDNSKNYVAMTVRGDGYSMARVRVYTPDDPDSPCQAGKMYTYTILIEREPRHRGSRFESLC